jgi:hypothetical protein
MIAIYKKKQKQKTKNKNQKIKKKKSKSKLVQRGESVGHTSRGKAL